MTQDHQTDLYIKRSKIQNRWVDGFYQKIRSITIWVSLSFFFIMPWINWNDRQAILFDIVNRQFHIFNMTFIPQDFYLLLLLLLCSALALIVVTNIAGRIWCGYTCPQTVWTKCYMWIEYMIEGDRIKRLKRDRQPWELSTVMRRILKHIIWLLLALITAATFVGYFTPIQSIARLEMTGWGYFWIIIFTFATYLNAGWMREQICLYICPYARFQSVMFDRDTMIISYDYRRGEPRGAAKKHQEKKIVGDCIDCQLCVQVCPTGIDIRDGLQMACIGCAACVDACNGIMDRVKKPRGLIRYHTENNLEGKKGKLLRVRLVASVLMLLVLGSVFGLLLYKRVPLQFTVARDNHQLYRYSSNHTIENSYVLTIKNLSDKNQRVEIRLLTALPISYVGPKDISINKNESQLVPIMLTVPVHTLKSFSNDIDFELRASHEKEAIVRPSIFISPKE